MASTGAASVALRLARWFAATRRAFMTSVSRVAACLLMPLASTFRKVSDTFVSRHLQSTMAPSSDIGAATVVPFGGMRSSVVSLLVCSDCTGILQKVVMVGSCRTVARSVPIKVSDSPLPPTFNDVKLLFANPGWASKLAIGSRFWSPEQAVVIWHRFEVSIFGCTAIAAQSCASP